MDVSFWNPFNLAKMHPQLRAMVAYGKKRIEAGLHYLLRLSCSLTRGKDYTPLYRFCIDWLLGGKYAGLALLCFACLFSVFAWCFSV
jgi:hypothetical protein